MAEAEKQEISVKPEDKTAWDEELSGKKRLFVLFERHPRVFKSV